MPLWFVTTNVQSQFLGQVHSKIISSGGEEKTSPFIGAVSFTFSSGTGGLGGGEGSLGGGGGVGFVGGGGCEGVWGGEGSTGEVGRSLGGAGGERVWEGGGSVGGIGGSVEEAEGGGGFVVG